MKLNTDLSYHDHVFIIIDKHLINSTTYIVAMFARGVERQKSKASSFSERPASTGNRSMCMETWRQDPNNK